jgi:hypothetical protein
MQPYHHLMQHLHFKMWYYSSVEVDASNKKLKGGNLMGMHYFSLPCKVCMNSKKNMTNQQIYPPGDYYKFYTSSERHISLEHKGLLNSTLTIKFRLFMRGGLRLLIPIHHFIQPNP